MLKDKAKGYVLHYTLEPGYHFLPTGSVLNKEELGMSLTFHRHYKLHASENSGIFFTLDPN